MKYLLLLLALISGWAHAQVQPAYGSTFTYNMLQVGNVTKGTGLSTGVRTTNGTQLQAAFTNCGTSATICYLPGGSYEYISQTIESGTNTGLQVPYLALGFLADGPSATKLFQFANNYPALTLGSAVTGATGYSTQYDGFSVSFGASQAGNTNGIGLLVGDCSDCFYGNNKSITVGSTVNPPYIGMQIGTGTTTFYSNYVGSIRVIGATNNSLVIKAGGTGSVFANLYLVGYNGSGPSTINGAVIDCSTEYGNHLGTFLQLNTEWFAANQILNCAAADFLVNHWHIEGNTLTSTYPTVFNYNGGGMKVGDLDFLSNWIATGNYTGQAQIFGTYTTANINIDTMQIACQDPTRVWSSDLWLLNPSTPLGSSVNVSINNYTVSGSYCTGPLDLTSSYTAAAYGGAGSLGTSGFTNFTYNQNFPTTNNPVRTLPNGTTVVTYYGADQNAQYQLNTALGAALVTKVSPFMTPSGNGSAALRKPGDTILFNRTGSASGAFAWNIQDLSGNTLLTMSSASTSASMSWTGQGWINSSGVFVGGGVAGLTIGTLPTCNAANNGLGSTGGIYITNGVASPTYLGTVSTTGTTVVPVFCNGTSWVYH